MRYGSLVTLRERVKINKTWINPDDVIWMSGFSKYQGQYVLTQFYLGKKGKTNFTSVNISKDRKFSDLFLSMVDKMWYPNEELVVKRNFNNIFKYRLSNIIDKGEESIENIDILLSRIVAIDKNGGNNIIYIKKGDRFSFSYGRMYRDSVPLLWEYPRIRNKYRGRGYEINIYPYLINTYFEESERFKNGIDAESVKELIR